MTNKLKGLYKLVVARTYNFIAIKIIFKIQYKWHARKPVKENKVIFIEPRFAETSSSLVLLRDRMIEMGGFDIQEMSIGYGITRVRYQIKLIMRFLKEMATAKYVFTTDSNKALGGFEKRPETVMVQAWHACGAFKKFGFSTADLLFGSDRKQQERYPLHRNYDIVTVSSSEIVWAYEEAMGLEGKNQVKPLGTSRTDVFFDKKFISDAIELVEQNIPAARNKKIILYAPTFRGKVSYAEAPDKLDISMLKEAFDKDYILLIKHHPFIKKHHPIPEDCKNFAYDVSKDLDIEELLCVADICISDYSSLIFEYSLFEKPMIFFAYDLEEYFDWRGFFYNYDELTPGPVFSETKEIVDYISDIENNFNKDEVIKFRKKFMSACDGNATERILEETFKLAKA